MRTGLPIFAAMLTACGVATTNDTNAADAQARRVQPTPKAQPGTAQAESAVAIRHFAGPNAANGTQADLEYRYDFASREQARRVLGAPVMDAFAAAGIRYDPARRQFLDQNKAYAPLILIGRAGVTDVIARASALGEGGVVELCEGCGSTVVLVRSVAGGGRGAGHVTELGPFDNNGMGSTGSVEIAARAGQIVVLDVAVGWATQGESGGSGSVIVIGEGGLLSPQIPLFNTGTAPTVRRGQIRLAGDRLTVTYPGARPSRAVFRIAPARLELIEGRVPTELTQQ